MILDSESQNTCYNFFCLSVSEKANYFNVAIKGMQDKKINKIIK